LALDDNDLVRPNCLFQSLEIIVLEHTLAMRSKSVGNVSMITGDIIEV
jgi:hypothetical protein